MHAVSAHQRGAKRKAIAMILLQSDRMRCAQKKLGAAGTWLAWSNGQRPVRRREQAKLQGPMARVVLRTVAGTVTTAEGGVGRRTYEEAPVGEDERPGQRKRRLLCIDGGGILGTFPAAFLAELEQHLDRPIGSYFDLIAGTSTGGIIGIALALEHSASEVLGLYENRGPEIFGGIIDI